MKQIELNGQTFELLFSSQQIDEINARLASNINADYKGKDPIIISVLDGSFMFCADLLRKLDFPHLFKFVKISSYSGMESTGEINIETTLDVDLEGQEVLIIEDIVDTGRTMTSFIEHLKNKGAGNIKICTLLFKPDAILTKLKLDYVGVEIKNEFVLGYGLDWDYRGRHYPEIYQMKKSVE